MTCILKETKKVDHLPKGVSMMIKTIVPTTLFIVFLAVACTSDNTSDGPTTVTYDFEGNVVPAVFTQTGTIVSGPDLWNVVDTSVLPLGGTLAAQTLASITTSCLSYQEAIDTSNVTFSYAFVNVIASSITFTLKIDSVEYINLTSIPGGWNQASVDIPSGQHTYEWCFSANEDAYFYLDDIVFTTSP